MSRKGNMYNKRGISKITLILIGGAFFLMVIFPFYGDHLRYLVFSSIYELQWLATISFSTGIAISIGAIFLKPFRKMKVIILGIILVLIGLALGAPNYLLSLFTGGPISKGYH